MGRLAYKLEVPNHWRIYPVFTVAQLEPAPHPTADPYQRPRPDYPDSIEIDGDTEEWKSWEVDRLLNKRQVTKGRGVATEYLVRWKGWGSAYDQWMNIKDLGNARDLVREYDDQIATQFGWPEQDGQEP